MNPAIGNSQFIQVALPVVLTLFIAAWLNGRGLDALGKRIDDVRDGVKALRHEVNGRFDRIDETLKIHGQKIAVLEDRLSPLARR
jgi:hypothetical protein